MFRWINGNDPRQYGLDFGLWTRKVAADLIERKFGIRLGLTAVGELLAKLNLAPQKPLQRAGNWCGEFAASVVKASGGQPPPSDHPVETGTAISDHAFKMPVECIMRCG